jgi:hypothetical protein
VSQESAINDDGSVFTRELGHNSLQRDAAAMDSACAPWSARVVLLVDQGPGHVSLSGGVSVSDVNRATS